MSEQKPLSKCCSTPVEAKGAPDFIGSDHVCTMHNECTKCRKDCDIESVFTKTRKANPANLSVWG